MKIQTFSIVVGTRACNAGCPFCISRMTGFKVLPKNRKINLTNLGKAIMAAKLGGTTTVLMTGKGEPTLYPDEMTEYLSIIGDEFPFIEVQTNALEIGRLVRDGVSKIPHLTEDTLKLWHHLGLDTIAISVVDTRTEENRKVYHEDYPPLENTVAYLKSLGYTVRLCVMLKQGCVDTPERLSETLTWCRDNKVDQLTVRPLRRPTEAESASSSTWVGQHGITEESWLALQAWVRESGTKLLSLMHGAEVYDVRSQNICLTDCLTMNAPQDKDDIRTLIFYSNGRIAYSWEHSGAVLLGGDL